MNSFEERLGAALADVQESAPVAHSDGGRAVFQHYLQGRRRRRQQVTMAMRLAAVTIVAAIGVGTVVMRGGDAPVDGNTPAVTTDEGLGQQVGRNGAGTRTACFKRTEGGCVLIS
jgi:hypothetical protein